MKIAVASGKGGTGKTTVATNLAYTIGNATLMDCDVEEPDSNIFVGAKMEKIADVTTILPDIDESRCDLCGKCVEFCRYNALARLPNNIMMFPELCIGCGGCALVCPKNAISYREKVMGTIDRGTSEDIDMIQGNLNIGEASPSRVIKKMKDVKDTRDVIIIDSPPGTSCPVIEAVRGADYVVMVTEPTPFGLNDLKLAVGVMRDMGLSFGVIINRYGMGDDRVEKFCSEEGIEILMKIPHDRHIAELYSRGKILVQEDELWRGEFNRLYNHIKEVAGK